MLEQIALSISTALFFLCSLIVSSILPTQPNNDIGAEPAVGVSASVNEEVRFSLIGKWNGNGHIFEFTTDGKLIYNGNTANYRFDGEKLTVTANINGVSREYTAGVEVIDGRNIMLSEIALHKVE